MKTTPISLIAPLLILFLTACALGKSKGSSTQSAPQSTTKDTKDLQVGDATRDETVISDDAAHSDEDIAIGSIEDRENPNGSLFEATYKLSVIANVFGGINVCKGQVKLIVNKDFTVTLPTPEVDCAGGLCKVDMTAVVGMLRSNKDPGAGFDKIIDGINSDKKFLSIEKFGNYNFSPPRPLMLLSPFYFEPISQAISVDELYQGTVTDLKSGQTANGSLRLKVTEANEGRLRWQMTGQGWDGIPRARAGIVNLMSVTWNLNPIAIPNISVFTPLGEVIAARRTADQQGDAQSLAKLCAGPTGQILGTLEGLSAGLGGDSGFLAELQQIGEQVVSDVMVGLSLDLVDQTILGQKQTPD